jgi:uroporphyrinogen decarboxylase
MTPRERWKAVLARKPVDRVPCDIWATDEVFAQLANELNCEDRWGVIDKLEIDAPYLVSPRYIGPALPENQTVWGVTVQNVDYGRGAYSEAIGHPLALCATVAEIHRHSWPAVEWFDYADIKDQCRKHAHRVIRCGYVEPFLVYSQMRGLEQALMDLVTAPDLVECAFDHIFDFSTRCLERALDQVGENMIDITVPSEDLGSQHGPLFSLACFRRFHKPRFQRYIDFARQAHMAIFYHTDGAARDFIPELVELGVDILNPIQYRCPGMDRATLKSDFGDKLVFHGAVENQEVLPFGTPRQVRREVVECFETLGRGGGYICAPCHNIQPGTPVENILAMYDTIQEICSDTKYTRPTNRRV